MKKIILPLILLIASISFYNCESNAINETTNPIIEDPNPITNLSFEEAYTFEANLLGGPHIGMTSSTSENSLYISCRENESSGNTTEEEIFKLNLDTNQLTRKNTSPGGFITKQLTISNNQLVSIGGTELKTYDLNIVDEPSSRSYFGIDAKNPYFTLSKFGIATDNENTYIIGGYRPDTSTKENKKIYKLNINSEELFEEIIDTPETMIGASAAVVNEKIYVFGGALYEDFQATNKIYIYPLDNSLNYEELSMTVAADVTYVHKYGEIILIAGHKGLYADDKTSFIGTFDPSTNIFKEIETNLDSEGGLKAIHQMMVKDDKINILFGSPGNGQNVQSEWSILTASLK